MMSGNPGFDRTKKSSEIEEIVNNEEKVIVSDWVGYFRGDFRGFGQGLYRGIIERFKAPV